MDVQIGLGEGSGTGAIVLALVSALAVVLGALIQPVGGWLGSRRADRKNEHQTQARVAFEKAKVALHLEDYALECARMISKNQGPTIEDDEAYTTPQFPDWPPVDWQLLGGAQMVAAMDLQRRVRLIRESAEFMVDVEAFDAFDIRSFHSEAAARTGLVAWSQADGLRREAKVSPFAFDGDEWNFLETLQRAASRDL